ncbi:MAG: RagB/SusD family nutrient uptake outer membrane protein, partial [Pseudomonadales bacterium]|nr:RagB/SusD family nutrient uptake outer membrane protein [Pseudomonadales bacterium]
MKNHTTKIQTGIKMKNLIAVYITLAISIAACDILEVEPESEISSENFFLTSKDAEAALMAGYDGLQSFVYPRDVVIVSGILSDETEAISGGNFTRHQAFNPNLDQGNIRNFWQQSYSAIHRCLDVLENVPNIDDPALDQDRVLGEAHFIKGLLYFNLTRYYGKIPIVERTTKSPEQDLLLSRMEVSEVYQEVIRDLEEAERLLPVTNTNRARATKGAAR